MMFTSQVSPNFRGVIHLNTFGAALRGFLEEPPAFRKLPGWAGKLEVVNVYNKEEFKRRMKVTTAPGIALNKAFR